MRIATSILGLIDSGHAFNDALDHNAPDGSVAVTDIGHMFVLDCHEWKGLTVIVHNSATAGGNLTCDLRGIQNPNFADVNGSKAGLVSGPAFQYPDGPNLVPLFDRCTGPVGGAPGVETWQPIGAAKIIAAGNQDVLEMHPYKTPWFPVVFMRIKFAGAGAGNVVVSRFSVYDRMPDNGALGH